MPNSQAPAHWSKDFVEHLRTVHFALIAISAGLILLVLSVHEYNATKALVEVDEILELQRLWSLDWMMKHVDKFRRTFPRFENNVGTVPIESDEITVELMENGKRQESPPLSRSSAPYLVVCRLPKNNRLRKNEDVFVKKPAWAPDSFPRDLAEFQKWWDVLGKSFVLQQPLGIPSASPGGTGGYWKFKIRKPVSEPPTREIELKLTSVSNRHGEDDLLYTATIDDALLVIPVWEELDLTWTQQSIIEVFGNVQPGVFSRSFSDLSVAGRDRMDLPFQDIKEFLHDEAAKGPEVFEAFGMKFPAGQITFWGLVLLLSVQLYFLAYLRQLVGKLKGEDPGWDVPWIGMDSSSISKTILYGSLVVLPFAAAILLGWQATARISSGYWERLDYWYHPIQLRSWPWHWHYTVILKMFLLIFAAVASGYLGLLSWKYRPQIAPEPSSPPSCLPPFFE
jgi:hypothetical protein